MSMGKRVKARREALHMTQDELAKKLGYKSRSSINKIELELTDIAQSKINAFACALKTTPAFLMGLENPDSDHARILEQAALAGWDISLDDDTQHYMLTKNHCEVELHQQDLTELTYKVFDFLNEELSQLANQQDHAVITPSYFYLPYYGRAVSAGEGQFVFDDLPSEMIEVEDTSKNRQADFAIAVCGNSMFPTYEDNDVLLVKKQNYLQTGDIGIFMINGEAFVKELGQQCLISHNKAYQPIQFNGDMRIDCIGKVIAKL